MFGKLVGTKVWQSVSAGMAIRTREKLSIIGGIWGSTLSPSLAEITRAHATGGEARRMIGVLVAAAEAGSMFGEVHRICHKGALGVDSGDMRFRSAMLECRDVPPLAVSFSRRDLSSRNCLILFSHISGHRLASIPLQGPWHPILHCQVQGPSRCRCWQEDRHLSRHH